ncbi:unnamed protein product, partial [Prorocentrum cordatum]
AWMALVNCSVAVLPADLAVWLQKDTPVNAALGGVRRALRPAKAGKRVARKSALKPATGGQPLAKNPLAGRSIERVARMLLRLGLPLLRINEFALLERMVALGAFDRGLRAEVFETACALLKVAHEFNRDAVPQAEWRSDAARRWAAL